MTMRSTHLLCCLIAALFLHTYTHAQTTKSLLGKWVNIHDTTTKLLLYKNGEAKIIFQDTVHHQAENLAGFWRHKEFRGLLTVFMGANRQQQDYSTYKRGALGMTLNNATGSVVFARRALEPGEALPLRENK